MNARKTARKKTIYRESKKQTLKKASEKERKSGYIGTHVTTSTLRMAVVT